MELTDALDEAEARGKEAAQQLAENRRRLSDIEGTVLPGLQV